MAKVPRPSHKVAKPLTLVRKGESGRVTRATERDGQGDSDLAPALDPHPLIAAREAYWKRRRGTR